MNAPRVFLFLLLAFGAGTGAFTFPPQSFNLVFGGESVLGMVSSYLDQLSVRQNISEGRSEPAWRSEPASRGISKQPTTHSSSSSTKSPSTMDAYDRAMAAMRNSATSTTIKTYSTPVPKRVSAPKALSFKPRAASLGGTASFTDRMVAVSTRRGGSGYVTHIDTLAVANRVAGGGFIVHADTLKTNHVQGTGVGFRTYTDNLLGVAHFKSNIGFAEKSASYVASSGKKSNAMSSYDAAMGGRRSQSSKLHQSETKNVVEKSTGKGGAFGSYLDSL